jgi:hypothetical protein
MKLKIEVLLSSVLKKKPIRIIYLNKVLVVDKDIDYSISLEVDYKMQNKIELFCIKNIVEGSNQQISVRGILINDMLLKNWRNFCQFDLEGNRYVVDSIKQGCYELCFNGRLYLNIDAARDQFLWFPYYYSGLRSDFVYENRVLDCGAQFHCFSPCGDVLNTTHKNLYINSPYDPAYAVGSSYDYGCFGCSITAGRALVRGQEWPALLKKSNSVINLAISGLGADGIFLNLTRALDSFDIKKIIILLPSLSRRLLRVDVDGNHFRIPVGINSVSPIDRDACVWFHPAWLQNQISIIKDRILSDCLNRYSKKIIFRMFDYLRERGSTFWFSSWSPQTYDFLSTLIPDKHLLPIFRTDTGALDGLHSSPEMHLRWVSSIHPRIS